MGGVVAGLIGVASESKDGLLPQGYLGATTVSNTMLLATMPNGNYWMSFILIHCAYNGGAPSIMLVTFQNGSKTANIKALIGEVNANLKYKVLSDGSTNIYLAKGSYTGRTALFGLANTRYITYSTVDDSEIDDTCVAFTEV